MLLLSEAGRDRLLVFLTAELARARRRRGLRLNVVEATEPERGRVQALPVCDLRHRPVQRERQGRRYDQGGAGRDRPRGEPDRIDNVRAGGALISPDT